ncbi:MAG: NAD(P)H-dependent glycerol-3-phosphate dehydrogenase [Mariprofundaceae bacterium]|nr:NAD(P)H-dependent glycerol-3-phosphate dehydrogenase [Mariprofundaceae bacterium]
MHTKVAVLGAGSWGTALAMVLARSGRNVSLLTRTEEHAQSMLRDGENHRYLPGISLPPHLVPSSALHEVLDHAEVIVLSVPCAAVTPFLARLQHDERLLIATSKGLLPGTTERMDECLIRHVGKARTALLSGPSFALEVARGMPTAITMAAHDLATADFAASFFDDSTFRIYHSTDLAGVALGGSLKNVIAIAAGIAEGMKLGHNAMSALVTRGMAEITRLSLRCGAQPETLAGLSGLGDLVLTCTGGLSRNRRFGMALAKGLGAATAREQIGQVVEGERTTIAVCQLATKLQVDMPIAFAVQQVLNDQTTPQDALKMLLARPQGCE